MNAQGEMMSQNNSTTSNIEMSDGLCLTGKYAKKRVYINYSNEFIKFDIQPYEKVRFTDITSITRIKDYEKNYGMIAFISTFIILSLCMMYYHYDMMSSGGYYYLADSDWVDILSNSIFTGLIWGGVAFVIGYLIKKQMPAFLIQTSSSEKFEIALSPQETEKFISGINIKVKSQSQLLEGTDSQKIDLSTKSNEQIVSTIKRSNAIDKYDDLIKLKQLLDQGILTKDEFDKEKQTVLGGNEITQ